MTEHLVIVPILLPLASAALLLLLGNQRRRTAAGVSIVASVLLLVAALSLAGLADGRELSATYRLGDWPTAVAIVLVADRLAILMVVLAAILGLVNSVFSLGRWTQMGPYQPVFAQLLMMGLNGAFLTGDLFNLFVFFEILLAASYALLLHGSGPRRVSAGLHYIVINLVASLLFLVGVSLIFGVTGTLNMAVLAQQVSTLGPDTRALFHAGASVLGVAFLIKAAAWPMGFWLPRTYEAAIPPAAAMFAIMTKVGIYALLRLGLIGFGPAAGPSEGYGLEVIFLLGMMTIGVGVVGMLAARDLGRMAGYSVLISAGTLLAALVFRDPTVLTGALLYLVISTLAASAFYLLAGLVAADGGDEFEDPSLLEAYDPDGDGLYRGEDERAVVIPTPVGILSAGFLICTLLIAGIPPLPGFLAKVAMISPLLQAPEAPWIEAGPLLAAALIASSLFALIAMARAGIQMWWTEGGRIASTIRLHEGLAAGALIFGLLLLMVFVQWPLAFIQAAAVELMDPTIYIESVLGREEAQP